MTAKREESDGVEPVPTWLPWRRTPLGVFLPQYYCVRNFRKALTLARMAVSGGCTTRPPYGSGPIGTNAAGIGLSLTTSPAGRELSKSVKYPG